MTHRAQIVVGVLSHKTKLDDGLDALVESIHEFRRLRKVASASGKDPSQAILKKTLPAVYDLRAKPSTSFHEIFVRTWSCLDVNGRHDQNRARLLLDMDEKAQGPDLRLILEVEFCSDTLRQR